MQYVTHSHVHTRTWPYKLTKPTLILTTTHDFHTLKIKQLSSSFSLPSCWTERKSGEEKKKKIRESSESATAKRRGKNNNKIAKAQGLPTRQLKARNRIRSSPIKFDLNFRAWEWLNLALRCANGGCHVTAQRRLSTCLRRGCSFPATAARQLAAGSPLLWT